jgi:hypothetical protein
VRRVLERLELEGSCELIQGISFISNFSEIYTCLELNVSKIQHFLGPNSIDPGSRIGTHLLNELFFQKNLVRQMLILEIFSNIL